MGYRLKRRTATVAFAPGHQFHGAEATVSLSKSVDQMFQFTSLFDEERVHEAIQLWGDEWLVEWNVESEDGEPLPPTAAGVGKADMDLVNEFMRQTARLMQGQADVDTPLEGPSIATTGSDQPQSIRTVSA